MARVTRKELDELCKAAVAATSWDLWLQQSATGLAVQRSVGAGAQPLGECMTSRECKEFLRGLAIGATFKV
jgi:hypothetical protein